MVPRYSGAPSFIDPRTTKASARSLQRRDSRGDIAGTISRPRAEKNAFRARPGENRTAIHVGADGSQARGVDHEVAAVTLFGVRTQRAADRSKTGGARSRATRHTPCDLGFSSTLNSSEIITDGTRMASCSPVCIQRSPATWHALTLGGTVMLKTSGLSSSSARAATDLYRDASGFPRKRAIDARSVTPPPILRTRSFYLRRPQRFSIGRFRQNTCLTDHTCSQAKAAFRLRKSSGFACPL